MFYPFCARDWRRCGRRFDDRNIYVHPDVYRTEVYVGIVFAQEPKGDLPMTRQGPQGVPSLTATRLCTRHTMPTQKGGLLRPVVLGAARFKSSGIHARQLYFEPSAEIHGFSSFELIYRAQTVPRNSGPLRQMPDGLAGLHPNGAVSHPIVC